MEWDDAVESLWTKIKAGIEINDGITHVGAVVTTGYSDWSLSPVPEWMGMLITIRVFRLRDTVIIKALADQHPWRSIRVCSLKSEDV